MADMKIITPASTSNTVSEAPAKDVPATETQKLPANFMAAILLAGVNLNDAINQAVAVTAVTTMEMMKVQEKDMAAAQAALKEIMDKIDGVQYDGKGKDKHASDHISQWTQDYQFLSQKASNVQNGNSTNVQSEQTMTATLSTNQKNALDFTNGAKDIMSQLSSLLTSKI